MDNNRTKWGAEQRSARWGAGALSNAALREIAEALEASPAIVLSGHIVGGDHPTGVMLSLAYEGDDVLACGKDILFWMRWHAAHGSMPVRSPRVIVNHAGDLPELVRLELDFGDVGEPTEQVLLS
jgi:hypothetical protein